MLCCEPAPSLPPASSGSSDGPLFPLHLDFPPKKELQSGSFQICILKFIDQPHRRVFIKAKVEVK